MALASGMKRRAFRIRIIRDFLGHRTKHAKSTEYIGLCTAHLHDYLGGTEQSVLQQLVQHRY